MDPTPVGLPARVLRRKLGTIALPTDLVARYRAVDREEIGGQVGDTAAHLDALENDIGRHGVRVPLVLALNERQGFLDGNHRLAAARRLGLAEVPVEVWAAPPDLRTDYGRPLVEDDLRRVLELLGLDRLLG